MQVRVLSAPLNILRVFNGDVGELVQPLKISVSLCSHILFKMSINWLPLSDRKNMPSVRIEIEENIGQLYGGYYDPTMGKLVAVHYKNDSLEKELASSLAHEYRHHIQRIIKNVPAVILSIPADIASNYEPSIRWYFRNSISELDALFYQNKIAKCDQSDWWLRKLVLPTKLT